jgi:hypothetical protein
MFARVVMAVVGSSVLLVAVVEDRVDEGMWMQRIV